MIKSYPFLIVGTTIGALAGCLYWKYIGCISGTCAITSRPLSSTLYGALLGALLFYSFISFNRNKSNKSNK